jgi:hypothetical protein
MVSYPAPPGGAVGEPIDEFGYQLFVEPAFESWPLFFDQRKTLRNSDGTPSEVVKAAGN